MAKNKSFFEKVFETVLLERMKPVQEFFNGYNSYIYIPSYSTESTFSESFKSGGQHMQMQN